MLRNLYETITERIQQNHRMMQKGSEGFADNHHAVHAELERQLSRRQLSSRNPRLVFVTGPLGPRLNSPPRPGQLPRAGRFLFQPLPLPPSRPPSRSMPRTAPVNEFSPPRARLFRIFPSRTLLF